MTQTILDRITYDLSDGIARITLVRGGASNGLDVEMGAALRESAERAQDDASSGAARVVVVAAEGRFFSVGGDLSTFAASADRGAEVGKTAEGLHAGLAILRALDVPVVSVIQGTAAGGGLGIGLVGDIIVAAQEAKLVLAYTASGLSPDCGLTWVLPHRLSTSRAMDLALTNRVLTATEAADWGLISRAVPAAELTATVDTLVSALRDGPRDALATTKRLLLASSQTSFVDQMADEAASISRLMAEPDGIEGVDAFLAKRTPSYR